MSGQYIAEIFMPLSDKNTGQPQSNKYSGNYQFKASDMVYYVGRFDRLLETRNGVHIDLYSTQDSNYTDTGELLSFAYRLFSGIAVDAQSEWNCVGEHRSLSLKLA